MPHESTVDPEDPMRFNSWGDESSQSDLRGRRKLLSDQTPVTTTPRLNQSMSMSIQTHPDLPLCVTHDHDDDGDPDDETVSHVGQDLEFDLRSRVTYTPPKRNSDALNN